MFCPKKLRITGREVADFYREAQENLDVARAHLARLKAAINHYSGTSKAIIREFEEFLEGLEPPELERQ